MAKQNRTMIVTETAVVSKTPQVNALVAIIKDTAKDGKVTEDQLREALVSSGTKLNTRQDPWLIFAYYRRTLMDAGFLVCEAIRRHTVRTPGEGYWDYTGV